MTATPTRWGAGFASTERFLAEIEAAKAGGTLRPGYVLVGDETFLYERCRRAVLQAFVPPEMRDFCLSDLDLAETNIFEALDRAQTPSLMAPVPSALHPQPENALHARREERRIRGHRRLFPLAQSAGAAPLCRRPHPHPLRSAPHGHAGQGPLRPHPRDAGRLLRHSSSWPASTRPTPCAGSPPRPRSSKSASSRTPPANSPTPSART